MLQGFREEGKVYDNNSNNKSYLSYEIRNKKLSFSLDLSLVYL